VMSALVVILAAPALVAIAVVALVAMRGRRPVSPRGAVRYSARRPGTWGPAERSDGAITVRFADRTSAPAPATLPPPKPKPQAKPPQRRAPRLAAGLTATVVALGALGLAASAGWGIRAAPTGRGLDLTLNAGSTGELAVLSPSPLLAAQNLGPRSAHPRGLLRIRNQTARPLAIRVKTTTPPDGLDDVIRLGIGFPHQRAFMAMLGQLRRPTNRAFRLEPGAEVHLRVSAEIVPTPTARHAGRTESVDLELVARPAKGAR